MAGYPNILYLHSHDTGRYIQPYGYPVPTPALQQLAEQGVLFTHAFCAGPTCSPSRAALLTGQSPHSAGMTGLAHLGFSLNDYRRHLVHTLRAAGYRSSLIGVQHVAKSADMIGYDRIAPLESHQARCVAPAAVRFFEDIPAEPFFLSVGFNQTHRAYPEPGPTEDPRWRRAPTHLPNTPETRRDWASYTASARELDAGIEQVLTALDRAGLAGRTLVICTTDHGPAFPRMKCTLTDAGTGVMLILRGPGGFKDGRVLDGMVSHMDLFPTLCDLLDIPPPAWLQGSSIMPLVHGEKDQIHGEIFSEINYHAAYEPTRAVRTTRWKYIRRFDGRARPVLPNCDAGPTKQLWMDHGWNDRAPVEEQLYDLVLDASEMNNLAPDPALSNVLHDMRHRLDHWMQATDDPLLKGQVPAPRGAVGMDPDAVHPARNAMKELCHGADFLL